jgi:CRISPR-associated endonuclease Cas1/CRISPR-associated protein Cas4
MEPTVISEPDLIPARMVNEWVYCPRLAILEHVHGEWAESAETQDGHIVHRRVDTERGAWPAPEDLEGTEVARALALSAPSEGLVAKLDPVEAVPGTAFVRPVDYKRGVVPEVPEGAYLPERVQVCAQALVLRENGYQVEEGALWFAASRKRVRVQLTPELVETTRDAVRALRTAAHSSTLPPPLVDSPKCNGCSLAPICLPDEVRLVQLHAQDEDANPEGRTHRRLVPASDDALPLHVTTQGAYVRLDQEELRVVHKDRKTKKEELLGTAGLPQTSRLALYGNVQVSTQALHAALDHGIPVALYTRGGYFTGLVTGMPHGNVFARQAQYAAAADPVRRLAIARRIVTAKLKNQRTILRRNAEGCEAALDRLERAGLAAAEAGSVDETRGHEGDGAAAYFGAFGRLLHPPEALEGFRFEGRNRRPPVDPVNAALSFCYALLLREWTSVLVTVGLDPHLGYLHAPRHGKPALALDLMEEFRPVVADSVILGTLNTGELAARHFVTRGNACNLNDAGRRTLLDAWERRLDTLVTHPVFGYRISYRRLFEVQARLFVRFLLGEIDAHPPFLVRSRPDPTT